MRLCMRSLVTIVLCVVGVSCSSKEDSPNPGPTSPTPTPTPTPASLSISGPNTLRTGQSSAFTATLTMSNGTTQNVTPGWTSDAASVLAVNDSGQGNALAHGSATIVASTQGLSASTLVRVYQDYQGTWVGAHRIRACDERGDFVGICKAVFRTGTVWTKNLPRHERVTSSLANSKSGW